VAGGWRPLARSADHADVVALYRSAGLDFTADLATLDRAPRIHADPSAAAYLHATNDLTGHLRVPVLTLHEIGDGMVPIENEQAYAQLTSQARTTPPLRQLYIRRAGHCTFTPAERIIALKTLERRINTGHWTTLDPATLNHAATALGPALNILTEIGDNTSNSPQPQRSPATAPTLTSGLRERHPSTAGSRPRTSGRRSPIPRLTWRAPESDGPGRYDGSQLRAGYLSADLVVTAPATWGIALTGPLLADMCGGPRGVRAPPSAVGSSSCRQGSTASGFGTLLAVT
jgi:hypothetical protein